MLAFGEADDAAVGLPVEINGDNDGVVVLGVIVVVMGLIKFDFPLLVI